MAKIKKKKFKLPKPARRVLRLIKIGKVALPIFGIVATHTLASYRRQHEK